MSVELKVYGNIFPASKTLEDDLSLALESAIIDTISLDVPLIELEKDLLRISFEGSYFPEEEVISVIQKHLTQEQQGKLDFLDIAAWHMRRYIFNKGQIEKRETSLNQVLDYSGF
ncbi:MAG: hypothetical protein IJU40_04470 [Desulfovibrionaceae bacterium]|nr:hypothetical protein [Desulfovibrionaceae bacterium]